MSKNYKAFSFKAIRNQMINRFLRQDKEIYNQNNIKRYNSVETIKTQNLGEHHASVTNLTIIILETLSKDFTIDDRTKYLATAVASIHDKGEVVFNDINYELKRDYPKLSEISNEVEHGYITSIKPYKEIFLEAQENKVARLVYKLADALDLILFVNREKLLGNKNKCLDNILNNGKILSDKCLLELFICLSGEESNNS